MAALLAVPLAGCAPLVDSMTIDEWTAGLPGELVSSTYGTAGAGQPYMTELAAIGTGNHDLLLDCRSREPVAMQVDDLDPVLVECGTTATVPIELERATSSVRITATATQDAWIAARVAEPGASIDCEDCEADAFVDGEPADGSVEESPEP